jgi:hypothetical protein
VLAPIDRLAAILSHLRHGDTLVVWRLDRLVRTTHQLVNLLEQFESPGARRLTADPLLTLEEIASRLGVGRTTLYRALGRSQAVAIATASAKVSGARAPGGKPGAAAATTDGNVWRADPPGAEAPVSTTLARAGPAGPVRTSRRPVSVMQPTAPDQTPVSAGRALV